MQPSGRLSSTVWNKLRRQAERKSDAIDANQHKLAIDLGEWLHRLLVNLANNRIVLKV